MTLLSVSLLVLHNTKDVFSLALWLAGTGHFCVLIASFQVPSRLHWKEDLKKLTPFNRKLMWVYGGFTVLTIIAFGILTLILHAEMLRGDRAAVALACFIGVYWASRTAVDFFYYDHADWPEGRGLRAGRMLTNHAFHLSGDHKPGVGSLEGLHWLRTKPRDVSKCNPDVARLSLPDTNQT